MAVGPLAALMIVGGPSKLKPMSDLLRRSPSPRAAPRRHSAAATVSRVNA